ncbi:CLUMA_CG009547, isoform C [Clunio marinus]|uniref:CLUMA_CG009547, isoform C n=1 Tax=Clunio marinus TaxID=568069 RepID=A0A1J1ICE8_9DIPT|nr:CLUMA_CG009547, isoform C [Clunio marinus]
MRLFVTILLTVVTIASAQQHEYDPALLRQYYAQAAQQAGAEATQRVATPIFEQQEQPQYTQQRSYPRQQQQTQAYVPEQQHQARQYQPQAQQLQYQQKAQAKAKRPQYTQQQEEEAQEDYDPNPSYQFGFDVKDDEFTNYQNRKEQREGGVIKGSYSVVDSDGFIRTVSYTADPKEGFKAEVIREPTDIVVKVPTPAPQTHQPHQEFRQAPKQQAQAQPSHQQHQQQYRQPHHQLYSMHRPGFWHVPKFKSKESQTTKKKVHFYDDIRKKGRFAMSQLYHEFGVTLQRRSADDAWGIRLAGGSDLNSPLIIIRVQPDSPAQRELIRGDIITKVEDYDARDLRHEDANLLFRTQDNKIRLVVRRDNKIAMNSGKSNPISSLPPPNIAASYVPSPEPYAPNSAPIPYPRGQHNVRATCISPVESLPHSDFSNHYQSNQGKAEQHMNYPPPPPPRSCFSPQLTRDSYQGYDEENAAIQNQPYRSTPLILPGAKVNHQRNYPTESYLRHHPNPQVRGPPTHDFTDIMMKQKVADSVLNRYGTEATNGPKLVHKQFNSPIGLYSDNLIENTIKNTVSPPASVVSAGSSSVPSPNGTLNRPQQNRPTKIQGYKKTVVYDPLKSETYRALQESSYTDDRVREVATPVQPKVFQPNRLVPGKKPVSSFPPPDPISRHPVNSLGESTDVIHQSGSFKRLMYHVLGETDY